MMLKERLRAGKKIYGTMIRVLRNPAVCYIAKNSGLDFVMYDCEHSNYTMETLHDLFITGNALGLSSFLRVPNLEKQYISRALDQGAEGVMVPMLSTAEMARDLVTYSKYQPLGNRGFASGIAYTDYISGGGHVDIMQSNNEKIISIAQIETKAAIDNADAIAATDGVDVLLVGPNDLSLALGIPGDLMNPIELEAIAHVAAACKKHGKAFGLHAGAPLLKMFYDDLTFVMMQSEIDFLGAGFKSVKGAFQQET
jgi:2-keto-3-deoxy-L-rhamnonate aldolase RhmA